MATTTPVKWPTSRDEAAEVLKDVLTDESQTIRDLARAMGRQIPVGSKGNSDLQIIRSGLDVLMARGQADPVTSKEGSRILGWKKSEGYAPSRRGRAKNGDQAVEFPYDFAVVRFDQMFVDAAYQRPLTSFAQRIERKFDPVLFQTLVLSDRGRDSKPRRFAIIDGQTRWHAAQRRGHSSGPAITFTELTPENEADIFWRLQKERRGMLSFHRFRAQLASGDEESQAIKNLANASGYELGEGSGQIRAVAALEATYRLDPYLLGRTLSDLREAWADKFMPESSHIRGLHYFFRHYPLDKMRKSEVDDERLVRRLKVAGPEGLKRRANAAREVGGAGGGSDKYMAQAIQGAYLSTGDK